MRWYSFMLQSCAEFLQATHQMLLLSQLPSMQTKYTWQHWGSNQLGIICSWGKSHEEEGWHMQSHAHLQGLVLVGHIFLQQLCKARRLLGLLQQLGLQPLILLLQC